MSAINITTTATAAPTIQLTQARDAYQLALATGFVGTLAEWLESLEGADGAAGANGPAGPNSVTSATSSDGTASLSVATLTAQGATLYSDPDYGSITASAGPYGQPEFTVGSITLSESEGKVRAGFLEATEGLKIGNISAQATGIALLGSETPSTARTALGLGTAQDVVHKSIAVLSAGLAQFCSVSTAGFINAQGYALNSGKFVVNGSGDMSCQKLTYASKTVSQLGAITPLAGSHFFCSNESGGAVPVFGDGANWRRVTDRAIIS